MWVINDIEVYQPTGSMGAQGFDSRVAVYNGLGIPGRCENYTRVRFTSPPPFKWVGEMGHSH